MKYLQLTSRNLDAFSALLPADVAAHLREKSAFAVGAAEEHGGSMAAVAVLAAEYQENTITLRWICVDEPWRGQGVAAALLNRTLAALSQVPTVRAFLPKTEALAPLAEQLADAGFHAAVLAGHTFCRMRANEVRAELLQAAQRYEGSILPVSEIPVIYLEEFKNSVMAPVGFSAVKQAAVLRKNGCLPVSRGCVQDGRVAALCLLNEREEEVELTLLQMRPGEAMALAAVLQAALQAVQADHGTGCVLTAYITTSASERLLNSLVSAPYRCPVFEYTLTR